MGRSWIGHARVINRSIRPADYIRITGRHKNSATKDLRIAQERGFLVASGQTRRKVFLLGTKLAVGAGRPA